MTIQTTADVAYPTRATVVAPAVKSASAFIQACGRTDLLAQGVSTYRYRPAALSSTDEGALKGISNGSIQKIDIHPHKLTNIEVITEEAAKLDGALTRVILEGSAPRAGRDVDTLIAGGGNAVIDGFTGVTAVPVTDARDLALAYQTAIASGETPSGFVISTAALAALYNLGLDGIRNPLSNLNMNPANPGTIMGLPVYVFASSDPNAAWLGDFRNSAYGNISVPEVRISRETSLLDETTEEVYYLWQQNSIGVLTEVFVAFKLANTDAFVQLVTSTEEDEEEEE